ncbi:MAG: leucine-rich repeat domain-containing protein [Defluviitaleaceae bacterium]|nr:leucine-rich repeat domain-containing protein [Defluviitaleaceae bacterium]
MRKIMTAALAFMLVWAAAPIALHANEISVTIDGAAVDFEGQPPIIVDGRTLVPVRGVFEALGFDVGWEQETQTATLTSDDYVVVISIGSDVFTTNGEEIPLDVPAQIIEDRTLLPIRAVLESVGYEVDWDGDTRTVLVTTPTTMEEVAEEIEAEPQDTFITIRGVQYSTALEFLNLGDMGLNDADIVPLQQMVNLRQLTLNNNQISNLEPLAGLTNLQALHMNNNRISDISPLSNLVGLEVLHLDINQISNLSPISGLTNLRVLWLGSNQISNLAPLSGLTNLTDLWLQDNQISSISSLSNLTRMRRLHLGDNEIRILAALRNLTELTDLTLRNNRINDLSPLSGLTNLVWLDMGFVFDTDELLAEIGFTREELDRMGVTIADIAAIVGDIGFNHITDWSPVSHVPIVIGRP